MSTLSSWKLIYRVLEAAVINLESIDTLLQQTVQAIGTTYQADCLVWVDVEAQSLEAVRLYGTLSAVERLVPTLSLVPLPNSSGLELDGIRGWVPQQLPAWFTMTRSAFATTVVEQTSLVLPVWSGDRLRCVLHLYRPLEVGLAEQKEQNGTPTSTASSWSTGTVEALQIVASQLMFALDALYWRQRLEQSRQQAALVGSIVRLLNSSLDPKDIMDSIVAELGRGLQSDRCILVDLRGEVGKISAAWEGPQFLQPIHHTPPDRRLWQDVIDLFRQGGASYLEFHYQDQEALAEWLQTLGAIAGLMMPLFVQEEFFGVVLLLSYQQERAYNLDELQTIRQVADQAAIALTNAQHYQSLWYKQASLQRQNLSLQQEIIHDPLTQLLNRRSLEHELKQLSRSDHWHRTIPFSLIVCDIDHFKHINDSYGHLIGDQVLRILAQRLRKQLRSGTPAYRYGGEEFIVVLPSVQLEQAIEVAERLRVAVNSTRFHTPVGLLKVTASFGVAQQQSHQETDAWSVLHRADRALYEAKRQGRDRVFYL